jgi:hypothetical protein
MVNSGGTSRPCGRNQTKKLWAFSFRCKFGFTTTKKLANREENAVKTFIQKYEHDVMGSLSGFDRLVLRGLLRRLFYPNGMDYCLAFLGVLLKDFGQYVLQVTTRLKEASLALARRTGRPIHYLASSQVRKDELAREIAARDRLTEGLICVLSCVEPCLTFEIHRHRESKRLQIRPHRSKCLHLYHYFLHPEFGFMSARLQTWFPLTIQVCMNGREWLARQLTREGIAYRQEGNCFTWIEDPPRAQEIMDLLLRTSWPAFLDEIARQLNPIHRELFGDFDLRYYWSAHQSEWATDIMFKDPEKLAGIYPRFLRHGLTTFASPDVMRFLGRKLPPTGHLPPTFAAEVVSRLRRRPEGIRIKHRVGSNHIKLYDKQGSNLRVETTINDPRDFKVLRRKAGDDQGELAWRPLRKGVADLHRLAQVSEAANRRYLKALAAVQDTTSLGALTEKLCRPTFWKGQRLRALNPYGPHDLALLKAVARGEFAINGFRNRDLAKLLYASDQEPTLTEKRRQSGAITRKLRLLRAHGLIKKVPKTQRYHLTAGGSKAISAIIAALHADTDSLIKLAA